MPSGSKLLCFGMTEIPMYYILDIIKSHFFIPQEVNIEPENSVEV